MRYSLPLCVAALSLLGGSLALAADAPRPAAPSPSLRQAAEGHFLVGGAIMSNALDTPVIADLLATQFSTLTGENEFKPASVQPDPGVFNFQAADRIADFARQHQIALIGHTLCWHEQTPRWVFADAAGNPLPREQALTNLKAHIQAVAGHFKGKVKGWDVVNEALEDGPGYLRETPAKKAIGEDFIIQAFQFAHEADPNAELYYNGNETGTQLVISPTTSWGRNLEGMRRGRS
jgi:endo-1,4-beta-xylanase